MIVPMISSSELFPLLLTTFQELLISKQDESEREARYASSIPVPS